MKFCSWTHLPDVLRDGAAIARRTARGKRGRGRSEGGIEDAAADRAVLALLALGRGHAGGTAIRALGHRIGRVAALALVEAVVGQVVVVLAGAQDAVLGVA